MLIFCVSKLPNHTIDYQSELYLLLQIESLASVNLLRLESQFQKLQSQFRELILKNSILLEQLSTKNYQSGFSRKTLPTVCVCVYTHTHIYERDRQIDRLGKD